MNSWSIDRCILSPLTFYQQQRHDVKSTGVLWNMFLVFTVADAFIFFLRKYFRLVGPPLYFSAVFTKGNLFCDFPFALPDKVVLKEFDSCFRRR